MSYNHVYTGPLGGFRGPSDTFGTLSDIINTRPRPVKSPLTKEREETRWARGYVEGYHNPNLEHLSKAFWKVWGRKETVLSFLKHFAKGYHHYRLKNGSVEWWAMVDEEGYAVGDLGEEDPRYGLLYGGDGGDDDDEEEEGYDGADRHLVTTLEAELEQSLPRVETAADLEEDHEEDYDDEDFDEDYDADDDADDDEEDAEEDEEEDYEEEHFDYDSDYYESSLALEEDWAVVTYFLMNLQIPQVPPLSTSSLAVQPSETSNHLQQLGYNPVVPQRGYNSLVSLEGYDPSEQGEQAGNTGEDVGRDAWACDVCGAECFCYSAREEAEDSENEDEEGGEDGEGEEEEEEGEEEDEDTYKGVYYEF